MGNPSAKRIREEGVGFRRPAKKIRRNFKKQKGYHSSSDESDDDVQTQSRDFKPVSMEESDDEGDGPAKAPAPTKKSVLKPALKPTTKKAVAEASAPESEDEEEEEEEEEDDGDDDDDDDLVEDLDDLEDMDDEPDLIDEDEIDLSDSERANGSKKRKRNDPTAFANSMSKILSSKLSTSKRQDPVLSRSVDAATASRETIDARLEAKAKRQLHAEKRKAMEKGRVRDVLGLESTDVSTSEIQEAERRLKKTAQRGVIKLFNAVRAAQVKSEQARAEAKKEGVVGMSQREERASEMSKQGFLDLLAHGGKKAPAATPQEA
ncbi:hypothetical protein AAFC00_003264 [Neodothiora populina]|uniref:Rrp15p-domain-containing protein n=1 Tax=Neodothiora populina TaxID=2781224 RepID=A0ABR3PA42_9PEZI